MCVKVQYRPNLEAPTQKLWQFDFDKDGKISKAELMSDRDLLLRWMYPVADNFDDYDQEPRDGFLDQDEIRQVIDSVFRGGNRSSGSGP